MPAYESPSIEKTLADDRLQATLYANTARSIAKRLHAVEPSALPNFQELRTLAHQLKRQTIEHLDHYLEEAERNIIARGGQVFWAKDAEEAAAYALDIARRRSASRLVKSKSMTTEEINFNARLIPEGLDIVETDLGEYIIQLAGQRPFHIVAPALHMNRYDVADLFESKLGLPREEEPEKQTMIARRILREKFLAADIGVSGANFVVAETGAVVIVENEGNARLTTSAPKVHIAVAGIEKLIPRQADLGVFLNLLARTATGQPLSVYTNILSGPRRTGEIDGPEEFHVIFLDNGRTRLLADREKRETLYCIRCGSCLTHCPVFRKLGGHNYPGTYSGPIGAILTPQLRGVTSDPWLPFASSLCGACAEVCPVKIDIPKILLALRAEVVEEQPETRDSKLERWGFRAWAWLMRHPKFYEKAGAIAAGMFPDGNGILMRFGPLGAWARNRELPRPAAPSFRQLWRSRQKGGAA
jgi:L-lactate dehydrogenase complex protein LldF